MDYACIQSRNYIICGEIFDFCSLDNYSNQDLTLMFILYWSVLKTQTSCFLNQLSYGVYHHQALCQENLRNELGLILYLNLFVNSKLILAIILDKMQFLTNLERRETWMKHYILTYEK